MHSRSDHAFNLRQVLPQDLPQLVELWNTIFGDPPELVDAFFSLLPDMGVCCVAACDDRVIGSASLIDGFTLTGPGLNPIRCGYLYAVEVDAAFRGLGLGAALSRAAVSLGRERGAELICTLPAEESLYRWYGEILGLQHRCSRTLWRSGALPPASLISAQEYHALREDLLKMCPHVVPCPAAMSFQEQLCRTYGGGFYRGDDMLFCAYQDEGEWRIPELLCREARFTDGALHAVTGSYLCSNRPFPDGFLWNLTLD